jgi:hypothetical protein
LARRNGVQYYLDNDNEEITRVEFKDIEKRTRSKVASPKYLFIFDDLGDELKTSSYGTLMKYSRQFSISTITAMQDLKDIKPGVLGQMRVVLLFGKIPLDRLIHAYKLLTPPMGFQVFYTLYKDATEPEPDDPKPFFYVNVKDNLFGRNFDIKYFIPKHIMDG